MNTWSLLVDEQQLMICACSGMTEYAQIVNCYSVTTDNHTSLFSQTVVFRNMPYDFAGK